MDAFVQKGSYHDRRSTLIVESKTLHRLCLNLATENGAAPSANANNDKSFMQRMSWNPACSKYRPMFPSDIRVSGLNISTQSLNSLDSFLLSRVDANEGASPIKNATVPAKNEVFGPELKPMKRYICL
jgi:hypothetical protein